MTYLATLPRMTEPEIPGQLPLFDPPEEPPAPCICLPEYPYHAPWCPARNNVEPTR